MATNDQVIINGPTITCLNSVTWHSCLLTMGFLGPFRGSMAPKTSGAGANPKLVPMQFWPCPWQCAVLALLLMVCHSTSTLRMPQFEIWHDANDCSDRIMADSVVAIVGTYSLQFQELKFKAHSLDKQRPRLRDNKPTSCKVCRKDFTRYSESQARFELQKALYRDKCNIYPLDTVDVCIPTQDFHIEVPLRQRFLASRPTSSLCQFHLSMSSTVEATLETDWHARSLWSCQLVHQLSRRRWSLEQRCIILWRALSRRSTARMFHGMHDENCM